MSETEALLPPRAFVRIYRSYIVSKREVVKIEKKSVWIEQTGLPVGAGYSANFSQILPTIIGPS